MIRPPRRPSLRGSLFVAAVAGLSCVHRPPSPPVPAADLAAAADLARALAPVGDDPVACVVLTSLGSALDAASAAFGAPQLPPVAVDVSACGLVLAPGVVPDDADDIARAIAIGLRVGAARVEDPCVRTWLDAAVAWSLGAVAAALDEVAEPDGLVEIAGVAVEAGECAP